MIVWPILIAVWSVCTHGCGVNTCAGLGNIHGCLVNMDLGPVAMVVRSEHMVACTMFIVVWLMLILV